MSFRELWKLTFTADEKPAVSQRDATRRQKSFSFSQEVRVWKKCLIRHALAFIGECEGWKALCSTLAAENQVTGNFLSRPDAHQDHRYVLLTLVYKSTTRDRQPCMEALWDRGREDEEGAESAEKDLSVWGRAWNHSARRICKDTKTASLWSTLDNMKIAFATHRTCVMCQVKSNTQWYNYSVGWEFI